MMRAMIEDEGCLGIMPDDYMSGARAQALRVEGIPVPRATGLLYRPDIPLRPIVMEFANLLRRELSKPPG
jgi:DNA-binding transcriptional LysR family regulator